MNASSGRLRVGLTSLAILLGLIWLGMLVILLSGGINLRDYGVPLAIHRLVKPLLLYSTVLVIVFAGLILGGQGPLIARLFMPTHTPDRNKISNDKRSITVPEVFCIIGSWVILVAGPVLELSALSGTLARPVTHLIIVLVVMSVCLWHFAAIKPLISLGDKGIKDNAVDSLVAVSVILFSLLVLFPAYTWTMGGRDPGVYVNSAAATARSGSFVIHNRLLDELPQQEKQLFFKATHYDRLFPVWRSIINTLGPSSTHGAYGYQYPGFYITDPEKGIITPQFFPYYSSLLAYSIQLFGFPEGLNLTPVLACSSLLLLYFLMRLLFNLSVSLIAVLLLATNCGFYWFAKTPNSECVVLVLFLIVLYASARYQQSPKRVSSETAWQKTTSPKTVWLFMIAFAMAEMFMTRIDSILLLPILLCWFFLSFSIKKSKEVVFWAVLFSMIAISAYIALIWCTNYTHDVLSPLLNGIGFSLIVTMVVLTVFCLGMIRRFKYPILDMLDGLKSYIPSFSLFLACLTIIYLNFVRTAQGPVETDAWNFIKLTWYVPPLMMLLSICGLSLLNSRFRNYSILLLLSSGYVFLFSYLWDDHIMANDNFFWFRRFLSFSLPLLVVGASYFIGLMMKPGGFSRVFGLGLAGLCIVQGLQGQQFLWEHRENKELTVCLSRVAAAIGPEDILFLPHYHYGLETPLSYIFERTVLVSPFDRLLSQQETRVIIHRFEQWRNEGRTIYAFVPIGHMLLRSPSIHFVEIGRFAIERSQVKRTTIELPDRVETGKKGFVLAEWVE